MILIDLKGPVRGSGWRTGSISFGHTVYIVGIDATMEMMGTETPMRGMIIMIVSVR